MRRFLAPVLLLALAASAFAAPRLKKEAQFVSPAEGPPNESLKQAIMNGRPVSTGAGAQAELRLDSGVVVRLGQNSTFALKQDGAIDLRRGAMLVRAPKSAGQTLIVTGNVMASVAGTTSLLEHYPDAYTKLIALEGTARIFMPSKIGESVLVAPGQLLMFHLKPAPKGLPNPVDIDIKRLMATSQLVKRYAPLGSESSIAQGAQNQNKQKSTGTLAETNLVIFGRGTLVSLVPPDAENSKSQPTPTPPKR